METLNILLHGIVDNFESGYRSELDKEWERKLEEIDKITRSQAKDFADSLIEATKDLVSGDLLSNEPKGLGDEWRQKFDSKTILEKQRISWFAILEKNFNDKDKEKLLSDKKVLEGLDTAFKKWAKELASEPEPPSNDEPLLKYVWERLEANLAHDFAREVLELGATRTLQLWGLILSEAELPKNTIEFLSRVSRCFIWGFDAECVILCRSAIDTHLRETISDSLCDKYEGPSPKHGYTLVHRIHAAYKARCIDERGKKAAIAVKQRGKTIAHYDSNAVKDVFGTIKNALIVISQLAQYRKRK